MSESLQRTFTKLKQTSNEYTWNVLLDFFDDKDLETIDSHAISDSFIAEKKDKIFFALREPEFIEFNEKLKDAFGDYSEALVYLRLKDKGLKVDRVREGDDKAPDFKVATDDSNHVFVECKALSFASGNLNYKNVMNSALDGKIQIENQLSKRGNIGIAVTEVQPLRNDNRRYDAFSTRYFIEAMIDKIKQNIKRDQFGFGDTVLIVDVKQLVIPGSHLKTYTAIYQEEVGNSFVSGGMWNVAFGSLGNTILRPIEFAGAPNTDGTLQDEGILIGRDWIKAIVFIERASYYKDSKIAGLYIRKNVTEGVSEFIHKFCDVLNDEANSNGWKLNE